MQQTVYNPKKGRLETVNIDFADENTTWFDECEDNHGIFSITDLQGGILIEEADYTYPLYVYDIFRADIDHDHGKARELHRQYIDKQRRWLSPKRHPSETPVALWVASVSPGIQNEEEELKHQQTCQLQSNQEATIIIKSTTCACSISRPHATKEPLPIPERLSSSQHCCTTSRLAEWSTRFMCTFYRMCIQNFPDFAHNSRASSRAR